jgi:hypothetical protein
LLTAIDGQINGGGRVDKFRIKIWDKNAGDAIVDDNQLGARDGGNDATELGAGSIVIRAD